MSTHQPSAPSDLSVRRMVPFMIAGVVGLIGNFAADEAGVFNGFVATLLVVGAWVLCDPAHAPPPNAELAAARKELADAMNPAQYENVVRTGDRYVRWLRLWLTVPTLVAALIGGWQRAAAYSFGALLVAGSAAILGMLLFAAHLKRRMNTQMPDEISTR